MLNVYKASAGSGKTHTITSDYIKLAKKFDSYFSNILAVTFTNKAAEEMKKRIIEVLFNSEDKNNRKILSKILHNYGYFNIGTIDSFVQKIIKSFSFELKIPTSYNLELDLDFVTNNLVDLLIENAQNDTDLQKWMEIMAFHNISSLKKWDFKRELTEFTAQIYKENFNNILLKLDNKNLHENILSLADKCKKDVNEFVKNIHKEINKGISIIKNSPSLSSIDRYTKSLTKFFYDNKTLFPKLEYKSYVEYFLNGKYEKNIDKYSEFLNEIKELISLINNILEYKEKNQKIYYASKNILTNIYNFNLILKVYDLLKDYRTDNNVLLISDLTVLLKNLLGDTKNNAPFIYEKIGTKLKHIMIDEFQDTSAFQWNNFKPLLDNSISEGNFNMIVGDVKQSIYRWRNGDWRILGFKLQREFQNIKVIKLDSNWRSHKNIILFNNTLFSILPKVLQDKFNYEYGENSNFSELITSMYQDVKQLTTPQTKSGGYVNLQFSDTKLENLYEQIALLVDELLDFYLPGDIGILVKTNKEGQDIVKELLNFQNSFADAKKYNIISNEALLLNNSVAVQTIINVLEFINNPNELFYAKQIAFYYQSMKDNDVEKQIFDAKNIEELKDFLPKKLIENMQEISQLNLFYQVLEIISLFELNKNSNFWPYLRTFEEFTNEFLLNNQSNLANFLNYWQQKQGKVSLSVNESKDSVNVMTIHKSKGLAFKVVIVPSISWNLSKDRDLLWVDTQDTEYAKYVPYIPIKLNCELLKTDFADYYTEEKIYSYIDSLNVLYVAFTRAKQEIYAFGKTTKNKNGSGISDMIYNSLKNSINSANELEISLNDFLNKLEFSFGKKNNVPLEKNINKSKGFEIQNYNTFAWNNNIKITSHNDNFMAENFEKRRNAINEGIKMHSIFEKIEYKQDIETSLDNHLKMNKLSKEEYDELKTKIDRLFKNQQIANLFSNIWKIYNEKKIITNKNKIYIPDRILENDKAVIVVDYKFGAKRSEHKKQIKHYKKLLSNIFPQKEIKGLLLYIQDEDIVEI